ncbi:toll-like receptor 13 [Sphaeramia orbicularis]|uniref:Toll-like receptor 13 n=1 Tax=Sphaeramia orbicularis TaxID=375764 RepID=A0A672YSS0_9TELE|nr:toll-like receptor 13 [Sphaeramia orbicularis]
MLTGRRKHFNLIIFICSLHVIFVALPVAGFSLKGCRISRGVAICSESELTAVPHDIPRTVKGIDLKRNKISKLQASDFRDFPVLTELNLQQNKISEIGKGTFSNLISLKTLVLTANRLHKLGDDVFHGLGNLTELRIKANRIKIVTPTTFKSLSSLKRLDISDNYLHPIAKVYEVIQHMPHLQQLNIQKNQLATFYSYVLANRSIELKSLDISQNPIVVFRITANVFPNLKSLTLANLQKTKHKLIWDVRNKTMVGQVSTLDISGLKHAPLDIITKLLQSFNSSLNTLRMNQIPHVPALIRISCTIPTLSKLQLQLNKLRVVRSDLFQLCVNIAEIDLNKNDIESIDDNSFTSLPRLRIVSLSTNKLLSVPTATRNLPRLLELDLSSNKIDTLKCDDFANLTNLRKLYLHQNEISALKDCVFRDLTRLEILKLQSNKISKFNKAFENTLPNLKTLYLHSNALTAIKNGEFSGMWSLQNLSLQINHIKTLEKECFNGLTNLTVIILQTNAITAETLANNSFNLLKNLRRLDLSNNHIQFKNSSPLASPPFSQLSHLNTLALTSQHKRCKGYLPSNLLQGLTNLLDLDIRNMQLISLPKDLLSHTPRLERLDVSANDISYLSSDLFAPIPNLTGLYISNIRLWSLGFLKRANLSKVEFLQMRKNQFSVISEDVIRSLPSLVYLDLEWNSFTCDCDNSWFLKWVQDNNQTQVFNAYDFLCNYPEDLQGMKLLELDIQSCSVDTGFICFTCTTCLIILTLVTSFTYHFLKGQLTYAYYIFSAWLFDTKKRNKQVPNQYDAFVSYNTLDEPWVCRELLPKLEGEQGWRLCLHHRDFQPGRPIIENITDAIYGSKKTICVISRRYLNSEWCSREMQVASFRLFDEQKDVLILVFLEEIPTYLLSPYYRMRKLLKKQTYLSWPRAGEHTEVFWEKLRQALMTGEGPADERLQLALVDRP